MSDQRYQSPVKTFCIGDQPPTPDAPIKKRNTRTSHKATAFSPREERYFKRRIRPTPVSSKPVELFPASTSPTHFSDDENGPSLMHLALLAARMFEKKP